MTRALTVYFDTSFYVQVQRSDEADVAAVLAELQALRVRRVESLELLIELDHSPNLDGKRTLVERLARWTVPPLQLDTADFSWLGIAERPEVWRELLEAREAVRPGHAWAVAAAEAEAEWEKGEEPSPADVAAQNEAIRATFGVDPEDQAAMMAMSGNTIETLAATSDFPPELAGLLEAGRSLHSRAITGELAGDELRAEALRLVELARNVSDERFPGLNQATDIRNDVLAGEGRGRQIAFRRASDKARGRFGSALADFEHLRSFIAHQHEIDLFMMDGKQLDAVDQRAGVAVADLRTRLFAAPTLEAVLDVVRKRAAAGA